MRVAAYQMPAGLCYRGDVVGNLVAQVRRCERDAVDLLCLPEATLGGLADYVDNADDIAFPTDTDALATTLRPLTSDAVAVIIGFTERDAAGRYYNSAALYSRGAVVGVYRKRHPAIRRSRYSPGVESPVLEVNGKMLGMLICRDSVDSSLAAELVRSGAELLCIPTNNAMPTDRGGPGLVDEVRALDLRHATTLRVPIVRADVIGAFGNLVSPGTSLITDPTKGQVGAVGRLDGELLAADLR